MSNVEMQDALDALGLEIDDRMNRGENQDPFRENALTALVVDYLVETGTIDSGQVAYWEGPIGRGSGKINGYGFSGEGDTLDIVVTSFAEAATPASVRADDLQRLARWSCRFVEGCFNELAERLEPATEAHGAALAIFQARGSLRRIRLFVVTDGISAARKLPKPTVGDLKVEVEVWDLARISRALGLDTTFEPIELDFMSEEGGGLPCLTMNEEIGYKTFLIVMPGRLLASAYEEFGARLLEFNVRSFLQVRGKVNKGMRETIQNNAERFMAYNNGIVVTAENVDLGKQSDGGPVIRRMEGVQIVNGGQTTATIHDSLTRLKANISAVNVAAKIIVIDPATREEVVKKVSQYANTQNPMQQADLSSNHPFHIAVERLSKQVYCPDGNSRWYYERARGQYNVERAGHKTPPQRRAFDAKAPSRQKFDKVELVKFIEAWNRRPQQVCQGNQKNFTVFMNNFRDRHARNWEPDEDWYREVVAKGILFRAAISATRSRALPAFRSQVAAYLVSYIVWRTGGGLDLNLIWKSQKVSDQLAELLDAWVEPVRDGIVSSAGDRNPTEWYKKEGCWDAVRRLDLEFPGGEISEIGSSADKIQSADEILTRDDLEQLTRVRSVRAEGWIRISAWGANSGELAEWQSGIAATLGGYAAQDWRKEPSIKQVAQAVKILNAAEEKGVLEPNDAADNQDAAE
jgi:hypothetical protein